MQRLLMAGLGMLSGHVQDIHRGKKCEKTKKSGKLFMISFFLVVSFK